MGWENAQRLTVPQPDRPRQPVARVVDCPALDPEPRAKPPPTESEIGVVKVAHTMCPGARTEQVCTRRLAGKGGGGGGGAGMHWKGRNPPSLQESQPMPSHCVPDAKCQVPASMAFVTDGNRLQPL